MKFGVNYTPKKNWFHSWLNPDWSSIKGDFDAIKGIGMDHIRMFHLWSLLQPNKTLINEKALDDLAHAVSLANECGLDVFVDALQGHLSSFDFLPSWLYSWHKANMFTDIEIINAEKRLIVAIWERLKGFSNFHGLTIGNELNQFSYKGHPDNMIVSEQEAYSWTEQMLSAVPNDSSRNGRLVLHSCYDASWIYADHPFTPKLVATLGDITSVHAWIFNNTAQIYGGNSFESYHHGEYCIELFRAFSEPNRLTWLQEIGSPLNVLDEKYSSEFCEQSVKNAVDTENLWGITWWCSHDVSRELADFPQLEYDLGLFDSGGNLKPIGETFSRMAKKYSACFGTFARPRENAIVVQVDKHDNAWDRGRFAPGKDLFNKWMDMSKQGLRPTFVLSSIVENKDELKRRNIKNLF